MLNLAKKTLPRLTRFFIVTAAILLMSLAASNKAYAKQGFDDPNKVCTDTANLQLVKDAIAVIAKKFPVKLGQGCEWHQTTAPHIIEPAKWYFANYTSNGLFTEGSPYFNAVLDLKYACDRSGGQWGPAVFAGPGSSGGHSYVVCSYYPKK